MTIKPLFYCALLIQLPATAMESPESSPLSESFAKKCTVSPTISKKRGLTILESMEYHNDLLEQIKEKRAKLLNELQDNIKHGTIVPYRVGISLTDFSTFCQLSYIIKKRVFLKPDDRGLILVELLISQDKENALITDPAVKIYQRLTALPKLFKE